MKLDKNHFFTTDDLFQGIIATVEKSISWGRAKIDYAVGSGPIDLYNYEFDPEFVLVRGGCEGIYMDLSITGRFGQGKETQKAHIGTIKTLDSSKEGIVGMSLLYGECLIAFYDVVDAHMDDITRLGFDLRFPNSSCGFCFSGIPTREKAIQKWMTIRNNPKYAAAILRDNLTRKEETLAMEVIAAGAAQ